MHARILGRLLLLAVCLVQPLLAQVESPPKVPANAKAQFEERLAKDAFFSKIDLDLDARFAPLHVYVQPPKKRDPEYMGQVANGLNTLFKQLNDEFLQECGDQLAPSRTDQFHPVIVLASPEDYDLWRKTRMATVLWLYRTNASYSMDLDAAVLFESAFAKTTGRVCSRWDRLRSMSQLLLRDRIHPDRSALGDWLPQGFCDWLASVTELRIEAAAATVAPAAEKLRENVPQLAGGIVKAYSQQLAGIPERHFLLHTFRDLATLRSHAAVRSWIFRKHGGQALTADLSAHADWAFVRQTRLAVYFLTENYPEELRAHMADWFRGASPGLSMSKRLPKPALLDTEFAAWLQECIKLQDPKSKFDLSAKVVPSAKDARAGLPAGGALPLQTMPDERFRLTVSDPSNAERLVLAFLSLARGNTTAALDLIDSYEAVDADQTAWIGRERKRIEAWCATRDAFVDTLVANGTKLRLEGAGKRALARVSEVSDGLLHFGKNKAQVEEVLIENFDPRILARAIPKAERTWVNALPEVWAGDERMKRALRGDDPELVALRSDIGEFHSKLDDVRPALQDFQSIVRLPKTGGDGRFVEHLAFARERIARNPLSDVFKQRRIDLEMWVRQQYSDHYTALPVSELLRGKVEQLQDDVVRIEYDFSDKAQLEDFTLEPRVGERVHAAARKLKSDIASHFDVQEGSLYLLGQGSYVHKLTLGGTLIFKSSLSFVGEAGLDEPFAVFQGFAQTHSQGGAWMLSYHAIQLDLPRAFGQQSLPQGSMMFNVPYLITFEQTGKQVSGGSNGEEIVPMTVSTEPFGRFSIMPHTAWRAKVDNVLIQGTFGPSERAATVTTLTDQSATAFWKGLE